MRTKVKLAKDLKDHGAPASMIAKAIDGYYDDYESPIATPIIQLVIDCEQLGGNLKEVAQKARNGEYDASKEEAESWFKKEGRKLLNL